MSPLPKALADAERAAGVNEIRRVEDLLSNLIRDVGESAGFPAGAAAIVIVGNLRDARGLVRAAIVRAEAMR